MLLLLWYLILLLIVYFWKMGPPKRRTTATDAVLESDATGGGAKRTAPATKNGGTARTGQPGRVLSLDPRSPNYAPPQARGRPMVPEASRGRYAQRGRV